jgi:RecD/TraA family predicted helicase
LPIKSVWTDIKKKYRIYSTKKYNQIKRTYETPQEFEEEVYKNTYFMLICYLEKSFKLADELALQIKPELKESVERCVWVCRELIHKHESEGNTKMNASSLARALHSSYSELMPFILQAVENPIFYYDKENKFLALKSTWENECKIANVIKQKLKKPINSEMEWQKYSEVDGMKLTEEQLSLLESINKNNIVMLNGSAGTGKSQTTKALIKMLDDNCYSYTLLAPTGIAAKRLRQATGRQASTIHMHLACHRGIGDFLIIDECSMIGVNLLGSLFGFIPEHTKIVLICDEAQLASISCGNIVQDIIDSGVMPIVNLTKVFRYGIGGIATVATDVRTGKNLSENMNFEDYKFIPISSNPINDILSIYEKEIKNYSPEDIMILSPFNVRNAGTYAINSALQNKYNTNPTFLTYKKQGFDIEFKIGDRIVNTENNYHMTSDYGDELAVMNGDIGTIIDNDGYNTTVKFDNGIVYLENNDMYKMLLATAVSVHKSQGNQAKCVIVVIDKSHGFFLNRNIEYVAMSRAQEKLIVLGDIDTINNALSIQQEKSRETYLKNMLIS